MWRDASICRIIFFMESMIVTLKQRNQLRTAETYKAALNSFKKFRNNEDVMLDAITSDTMMLYESHLKSRGNTPNTISFYMRILRAVYNNAVDNEVIENRYPNKYKIQTIIYNQLESSEYSIMLF